MKDEASFLGRGWSFPPRFNAKMNQLEMVETADDIRESLTILFSTRLEERLAFPEYGSRIHDLILESMNESLKAEIEKAVREAIGRYETRIDILAVNLNTDELEGVVYVGLEYLIRKINVRNNIVYPFYKLEGTELAEN